MKRIGFLYLISLWVAAQLLFPAHAWAQLIHTAHDHIPNFAANPTISSASSGAWSSPSTWTPARVPGSSDVVGISHTVTYDSTTGDVDVVGINAGGTLRFATNQNTSLRVGTLMVLSNGVLEIGTPSGPLPANLTAEIIIKNKPIDVTVDPDQFGTGLLAIDGKVSMYGAAKTPTFVRTAAEPLAGNTTIQLESAVSGWRVGDRVFLPDSRQVDDNNKFNPGYSLQFEERTIQSISSDNTTLTLSSALSFSHRGARDANGTPTITATGTKLLPHVGNLTRNIVIRSETPSGTRGHTLYTNRSDVDIYYVQFQDLGRTRADPLNASTNHIGRYPLHAHHLWGPVNSSNSGYQFELVGNAVNNSLKWPVAVHGSHYGLVKANVVFGGSELAGAGIAVEDGTETENLFDSNFVANIRGNINPRESGPNTADGSTPGSAAECFWAAGFNNRFINNVATGCRNPTQQIVSGVGFKFIVPGAPYTAKNPRFRGADMTNTAQTVSVTPQMQPILEFRNNEVYGVTATGITIWNLGTTGYDAPLPMAETLIKDFRSWHTYFSAIWNYPVNQVTIDGLVYRIDPVGMAFWEPAVASGDYRNINLTIRNADVQAGGLFGNTEAMIGNYLFENNRVVAHETAVLFKSPHTPGTGDRIPSQPGLTATLRNNVISAWPGQPLRTIGMVLQTGDRTYPDVKFEVYVYNYQGQGGNDFRVYFKEQATQNVAGGLAPCNDTTARPEISGITCPMTASSPSTALSAPAAPSGLLVR
jgi:hypothetical protein